MKLYLVFLGGTIKNSHIEMHDVRWVLGENLKETIPKLREEWVGDQAGLHIDSYIEIKYIDGYSIEVIKKKETENTENNPQYFKKKLWFINLGGYDRNQLAEVHAYMLIISKSRENAIKKAKNRWVNNYKLIHKDKLIEISEICSIEKCLPIEQFGGYVIRLNLDPQNRNQLLVPDWYGYKRIDSNQEI